MKLAIKTAKESREDLPIGAVILRDGIVIAKTNNRREERNDITSHAEIEAIKLASQKLDNWRLEECEMYVTLEPCPMCAWAILQSRIKTVYFGSYNTKYGALGTALDLTKYSDFKPRIYGGIMEEECDELLEDFWKKRRQK